MPKRSPDLRRQGRLGTLARALAGQAWAAVLLGDARLALTASSEARALGEETGYQSYAVVADVSRAASLALLGQTTARVHHISKRQVYKLWSRREVSLSQWIIQERLEGARADLGAAGHSRMTMAAVAHKWGFTDTTFFSRRFREAYSMSPREWRQIHASTPPSRDSGDG